MLKKQNSIRERAEGLIAELVVSPPLLHDWGNGLQYGGLEGPVARRIGDYLLELGPGEFSSAETGGGLSSLIFLSCSPKLHITISPDPELKLRLEEEAERRGFSVEAWNYQLDYSECVLPALVRDVNLDIALIDGGHGWPTIFVDFCYLNMSLREGGILIVDDILLFSCQALFMLLKHQPGWKLEHVIYSKTAFFRKLNDEKLLPDFGGQPYIVHNAALAGVEH